MYLINDYRVTPEQNYIRQKLKDGKVGFRYFVFKKVDGEEVVFIYKKITNNHFDFIVLTLEDIMTISEGFSDDQF